MLRENALCVVVGRVQDSFDLLVHPCGGLLGAVHIGLAVQVLVLHRGRGHEAEFVAHAVLGDHVPGQRRGPLDVIGGAGGLDAENHLLGGTAANQGLKLRPQLVGGGEELFLLGHLHGVAQSAGGMGHDGDFGNRLGVLFQGRHQGVAHFVVGNQPLFHVRQHRILLLGACNDGLKGHQQVLLIHGLAAHADGPEGRFIHKVCQIRAYGACSGLGNLTQVHVLAELDFPGVDLQGVQTALEVGTVHDNPAIETAGPEQGFIQDFRTVGSGKAHNALAGLKAVDLAE